MTSEEGDDGRSGASRESRSIPLRPIQVCVFLAAAAAAAFLALGFIPPGAWRVITILFVVVPVIAVVDSLLGAVRMRLTRAKKERTRESSPPIDPSVRLSKGLAVSNAREWSSRTYFWIGFCAGTLAASGVLVQVNLPRWAQLAISIAVPPAVGIIASLMREQFLDLLS